MQQFEWEQSNSHVSYPFIPTAAPSALIPLVVDALLFDTSILNSQLYLLELSIGSPLANSSIEIRYVDTDDVFLSGQVSVVEYGQWVVFVLTDSEGRTAKLLLNSEAISAPVVITTTNAVFLPKVTEHQTNDISSIQVTDGLTDIVHTLTGEIEFAAGYNITMPVSQVVTDSRGTTDLTISNVPGSGLGLVDNDCTHDLLLRTINGVGPDDAGHLELDPKECYRYVIPYTSYSAETITVHGNYIQIFNDCFPCCECEDFDNVYKGMDRLYNKGRNIGLRLANVAGLPGGSGSGGGGYAGLREDMEDERQSRRKPSMDIFLRPTAGYIVGVELLFRNNTPGTPIGLNKELNIGFRLTTDSESELDFDPFLGKIIPDTVYVFNSSRGFPWERRTIEQIFPDYENLEESSQPLILEVTRPTDDEEDDEEETELEVIIGTEYVVVFFEVYFSDEAKPEKDAPVDVQLTSELFKPFDLEKSEVLIAPFEGVPDEEPEEEED